VIAIRAARKTAENRAHPMQRYGINLKSSKSANSAPITSIRESEVGRVEVIDHCDRDRLHGDRHVLEHRVDAEFHLRHDKATDVVRHQLTASQ
jgi:hypothetical protein